MYNAECTGKKAVFINFHSLEYFTVLAREQNFTRAAQQLHITQQTLSAHIAGLEKELGCALFVRRTPLELTYAGRVFLRYAGRISSLEHTMRQELCDISQDQKGELRVGVAFTRGRAIMPRVIEQFQSQYPGVSIRLVEDSNQALQKLLLDDKLDLAIANFPDEVPGVELRALYRESIVLCIAKSLLQRLGLNAESLRSQIQRRDLSALAACPFVLGVAGDIAGVVGRSMLRQSGVEPIVRAESENIETLLELCQNGIGACFTPDNLMHTALSPDQLDKVEIFALSEQESYTIRVGWQKQNYSWSMIERFIESAQNCLS